MSELYFLKFVAKDSIQRTNVIFCAIANKQKNTIEKFETLVSYSPELINIQTDFTYKDVVSKIQKFMLEGNYVQNATLSFSTTLKNSFSNESFVLEFIYYLETENEDKLNELLKQQLVKILGKNDVYINSKFYPISKDDVDKTAHENKSAEVTTDISHISDSNIIPQGSIVTNFTFSLSPVHGVRADELKVNDKVMIKIAPENEVANNVINLLSLKDDVGIVRPAPATIAEIKRNQNEIYYVVKITDGIFAKNTETEIAVRVKLATSETLSSSSKTAEEFEIYDSSKQSSSSLGIGISPTTLLIAGAISFVIIAWILVSVLL
jgi:hypothetical protein